MIDRTARMRGIYGSADMTRRARRICKNQASRRSRAAARQEVLQSDLYEEVEDDSTNSTWTVLWAAAAASRPRFRLPGQVMQVATSSGRAGT